MRPRKTDSLPRPLSDLGVMDFGVFMLLSAAPVVLAAIIVWITTLPAVLMPGLCLLTLRQIQKVLAHSGHRGKDAQVIRRIRFRPACIVAAIGTLMCLAAVLVGQWWAWGAAAAFYLTDSLIFLPVLRDWEGRGGERYDEPVI